MNTIIEHLRTKITHLGIDAAADPYEDLRS